MAVEAVNWRRRRFPFNAEQTVNIVAEVGPLFAMFIVNGLHGISGGTWALIICTVLWVQIKVSLFNALVAFLLWIGLRAERNFFRFVFHKTFHFTEESWHNLTRNAALFFLATAVANEAVRFGFADAHIIALNRVFTGIDIWILFKIFIVMPATVVFFWWQVRLLQKHQQLYPLMNGGSRNGIAD